MIRDICKDEAFLAQKAELATPEDLPVAADLLETLEHHKDGCVLPASARPSGGSPSRCAGRTRNFRSG